MVEFVEDIMDVYDIDIAKIIAQEIHDRAMSVDTSFSFPFLLTLIFLD